MTATQTSSSKGDQAYALLRGRILDGVYGPGSRLVIDALARELQFSSGTVREAIRRLQSEGLLVHEPNVGARVNDYDVTHWLNAIEVVAVLESRAVALSAPYLGAADFASAARHTAVMRCAIAAADAVVVTRTNRDFHESLAAGCPNPLLLAETRNAWDRLDAIQLTGFRLTMLLPVRAVEGLAEHDRLIDVMREEPDRAAVIERLARRHRQRTIVAYRAAAAGRGRGG